MIKRFIDVVLSTIAILILFPFLTPVMAILKLTGEGYIFYQQKRVGKNGKLFNLYKFSTMFKDSPNMRGGNITSNNDYRILPFGKFLRKYKINELPQVVNVFLGDMSVIGRRPMVSEHFEFFDKRIKNIISKFKPGLSGVSSIVFRHEEQYFTGVTPDENKTIYRDQIAPFKGELELWYCRNQSVIVDLLLIMVTLSSLFILSTNLLNKLFWDLPKHPIYNPK